MYRVWGLSLSVSSIFSNVLRQSFGLLRVFFRSTQGFVSEGTTLEHTRRALHDFITFLSRVEYAV